MKKILALLTAYSLTAMSFVGLANHGKVAGKVATADKPVEAATISLLKAADSSLVKMVVSAKNGEFQVEKIQEGKYLLTVTAVGYNKYYSETFQLSAAAPSYTVKKIDLSPVSAGLKEVTVSAKKLAVEQKLDKTVVNVDASPTNAGLTAMEVLEKSPGVSVDKDGNISLKGKQGVMVMMDGKPTYLSAQDLANYLKNLPSTQLEQIEIMTNPPAKYDAAGNSGIINIKTKKNKAKGFNGSVTIGAGQGIQPKTNNSLSLNYRTGKWNLFSNYSFNWNKGLQDLNLTRKFNDSVFVQHTQMTPNFQNHNVKIGADFYASKKTTLGVVFTGFRNFGTFKTDNTTYIKDFSGTIGARTDAHNRSEDKWKNGAVNLNFRHTYDSTGKELTADIDYANYSRNSEQSFGNYFYDELGAKKHADELIKGSLPSDIKIYSAKVDYTLPLKKDLKLEAGAKTSYVETDNDARYANLIGADWIVDQGRTNHFVYKENINAVYVNSSKQFNKKWSGQLGVRVENTVSKGNQLTTGQRFDRDYTQIFPTAYVGYVMDKSNQFSLNYGRRINRPNYQDLNPFYYFLDKYTYEKGNPYLNPQFSHNIDLNHSFKGFLNTSLNYSQTKDIIQQIFEQVDSTKTTFVTRKNIAKRRSIGASVSANIPVTKWWRANVYTNVANNHFEGLINNEYLTSEATTFTGNVTNSFTFKKGWTAELSGFYRSKAVDGPMVARGMGVVNLGVGKQVLKNKGTVRLNVRDFLDIQQFRGYAKYQNIDVDLKNQWDNRVVNVTFTYRFGRPIQNTPQRKKGGANEEQSRVNAGGGGN